MKGIQLKCSVALALWRKVNQPENIPYKIFLKQFDFFNPRYQWNGKKEQLTIIGPSN